MTTKQSKIFAIEQASSKTIIRK